MAAEKFKVGERARVKMVEPSQFINGISMKTFGKWIGMEVEIIEAHPTYYAIYINGDTWRFTDEMLEPITPTPRWYVGQSVWDGVLFPGITGKISGIYGTGVIESVFNDTTYYYYPDGRLKLKTLSAVPYTFKLPPQPEPIWIPEKWERVLVRDMEGEQWQGRLFDVYDINSQYPFRTANGVVWKYCIPFDPDKVGKV